MGYYEETLISENAVLQTRLTEAQIQRDELAGILTIINNDAKNSPSIISFAAKVFGRLGVIREALSKLEE
jgi:hypothetical protein